MFCFNPAIVKRIFFVVGGGFSRMVIRVTLTQQVHPMVEIPQMLKE